MQYLDAVLEIMQSARRLLFITGAGLSADSGLPTYRGIGGLYESESTEDGVAIEDALSGQMLTLRPELTWKYLSQIERACRGKRPNAGHEVIASLESLWDVSVITQNIDGFHTAAGSSRVIEMHGNMQRLRCMQCGAMRSIADYSSVVVPPSCSRCGGTERPDVVLFGEMLPENALAEYYRVLNGGVDMVFSVGTSSLFPYIYGPVEQAIQMNVPTVEVNPALTQLSGRVQFPVKARAAIWLQALWEKLEGPATRT